MESAALAPTTYALLRPDQVDEMRGEEEVLEKKLHNPRIEDKGAVQEQLRRITKQLEKQLPRAYVGPAKDAAIRREAELREQISVGMLSHEEMRKCPPGAVDRHRRWEKDNKLRINEWQNIQRRLGADGDDRESASIENFRPTSSTMSMDGALIPGSQYFLPPRGADPGVTFSEDDIAIITKHAPEMALKLALLDNRQRAEVKAIIAQLQADEEKVA